jgi:peptidoglycan/LPS O-acetylase OafA/YrhL
VIADVAGVSGLVVVLLSQSVIGRALFLPLGAAGCLYGALYGHHVRRWLSRPWVYIIGGMCYSIYLLHIGVISLLGPITTKLHVGTSYLTNVTIQTIVLGTATMIVSIVFFLLIERPCMDPDWPSKAADALRRRARRVPA